MATQNTVCLKWWQAHLITCSWHHQGKGTHPGSHSSINELIITHTIVVNRGRREISYRGCLVISAAVPSMPSCHFRLSLQLLPPLMWHWLLNMTSFTLEHHLHVKIYIIVWILILLFFLNTILMSTNFSVIYDRFYKYTIIMVKFRISWSEEQPTRQQSMYTDTSYSEGKKEKASWTLYENISRESFTNISRESYFKCFTRLSNCPPLEHLHEHDNASWLTPAPWKQLWVILIQCRLKKRKRNWLRGQVHIPRVLSLGMQLLNAVSLWLTVISWQ